MLRGKEKIYFLLDGIEDVRAITPSSSHLKIHPTNDLNNKFSPNDLMQIFTKLEKDEQVLKVLKRGNRIHTILDEYNGEPDDSSYHIELLSTFDKYYLKIQNEPEYQKFTGKKPVPKTEIQRLYEKITEVDEQIRIRREALAKAQSSIGDNSFYSEATRVGHLAKLEQQAQTDIGNFIKQKKTYLEELSLRKSDIKSPNSSSTPTSSNKEKYNQIIKEIKQPSTDLKSRYKKTLQEIKSSNFKPKSSKKRVRQQIQWPDNFCWEGKKFVFGKYGELLFRSDDRQHMFKTLTDKRGNWATIRELKGNKSSNYVRSTLKQIKNRFPPEVKKHISIISTQEDSSTEKPSEGAYKIVLSQPKPL